MQGYYNYYKKYIRYFYISKFNFPDSNQITKITKMQLIAKGFKKDYAAISLILFFLTENLTQPIKFSVHNKKENAI